jgi:glycosyltransferase involved in cell wall biosynthesis
MNHDLPAFQPPHDDYKVILAHDFLNQWGGGERVLQLFAQYFRNCRCEVVTITHNPDSIGNELGDVPIRTSLIQRLPGGRTQYKWYLALMPWAVHRLNLAGADLVLSDSSGFIKGVRAPRAAAHVCYLHTPTRYVTVDAQYFKQTAPKIVHWLMPAVLRLLKKADLRDAAQPDYIIANSQTIAARCEAYYGRKPEAVLFPPVDTRVFHRKAEDAVGDYYITAARLVPYKHVDLAVRACTKLGKRLVVLSTGPEEAYLRSIAGPTIEFAGRVSDEEMRHHMAHCRALIFPPLEDAGMTPLETMSCGRPVLAYSKGGALESVKDGVTGYFFDEQTVDAVAGAIEAYEQAPLESPEQITAMQEYAQAFSEGAFLRTLGTHIHNAQTRHG